jgi:hypothetical protein
VPGALGPGLYELDRDVEVLSRVEAESKQGQRAASSQPVFSCIQVAGWASPEQYLTVMRTRANVEPITFPGHGGYYRVVGEYLGMR